MGRSGFPLLVMVKVDHWKERELRVLVGAYLNTSSSAELLSDKGEWRSGYAQERQGFDGLIGMRYGVVLGRHWWLFGEAVAGVPLAQDYEEYENHFPSPTDIHPADRGAAIMLNIGIEFSTSPVLPKTNGAGN